MRKTLASFRRSSHDGPEDRLDPPDFEEDTDELVLYISSIDLCRLSLTTIYKRVKFQISP
jgi:hypothetical protein